MPIRNAPIRRKLLTIMLLTSGLVLALTCAAFLAYDFLSFKRTAVRELATIGQIIATNSTAALAFQNPDDAREVLGALKAERHIVAATLFDSSGNPFALYPEHRPAGVLASRPGADGFRFERSRLIGFEPVIQGGRRLGTLYLEADLGAFYQRLRLYASIALLVIAVSILAAYLVARRLQRQISDPILALAETATAVSDRRDYSVRAPHLGRGRDELSLLTDAFNQMLGEIEQSETKVHAQLARLHLLNRITRSIGQRQDLSSIFRVVMTTLEDHLPIDFGCVCLYDPGKESLAVAGVGAQGQALSDALGLQEGAGIPIDRNGLLRCVRGNLVYEPDTARLDFPFPQRLARQGFRSMVAAPLLLESQVFGVLVAARRQAESFSSPDCEFLGQLSEHVALAAHQGQIYHALQQAFDELRQSQQTVLQHERLRALGEMASGIAHDINNAISPVALYAHLLLEQETNLSMEAREYLVTIERAIEDVAATVARLREFYRPRETHAALALTDLNRLVPQVLHLTSVRWRDMPQRRGVAIETETALAPALPPIMAAENEIREALTNLIFNAVDAMPAGGRLTIRTSVNGGAAASPDRPGRRSVHLEVTDTGVGMNEETRSRCLEPFFTTKGERGTGLGLAMVYGAMQRHSADLEIDSAPGKGTTMRLSFAVPVVTAETPTSTATYAVSSPLRILVVDDDPLLLKSLRDALEVTGHKTVTAGGGQAGIESFRSALTEGNIFDAVITDLGMPYVDGHQVAHAVKQVSPSTPVIMLTGWGQRMADDGELPAHVDRVLSKPPKLRELNAALGQCCQPPQPSAAQP